MFKIGTLADWFGVGPIEGIRESARCGASGVQLYAWNELDPSRVGRRLFRELRSVLSECSQEVTALCAELGGHGFEIAADNPRKVEYIKRAVDLAAALDCGVVYPASATILTKECQLFRFMTLSRASLKIRRFSC